MEKFPTVDINILVHNSEKTIGSAIESVLVQTWQAWRLTVIDDGSTDRTTDIIDDFAAQYPTIRIKKLRCNGGAVASFQRAFWQGDADFVMLKSGDDLIAPDFVEKTMEVLRQFPDTAMCHAAGLIFRGDGEVKSLYPKSHCLHAVGPDRIARARHVMAHYTSSPSFWGIYRRDAVDRLARIRYRAGWDHALLAELALYGEIRHVPEYLYWRRDGGKPIRLLARSSTERGGRGLDVDAPLTEALWRMPLITTVLAHLETLAVARISEYERFQLWRDTISTFRRRWLPAMCQELKELRNVAPDILANSGAGDRLHVTWVQRDIDYSLAIAEIIVSETIDPAPWSDSKALSVDQNKIAENV